MMMAATRDGSTSILEQLIERGQAVFRRHAVIRHRKRHVINVAGERTEAHFVRRHFAGQRHRHVGAAMEAAAERDHRGTTRVSTRDLHRVLHGFGAGGDEHGLLRRRARRQRIELLGQLNSDPIRRDHHARA